MGAAGRGVPGYPGGWNTSGCCSVRKQVFTGVGPPTVHPRMLLWGKGGTAALGQLEYLWVLLGGSWLLFPPSVVKGNEGREAVGWWRVVPGSSHPSRHPCVYSRP